MKQPTDEPRPQVRTAAQLAEIAETVRRFPEDAAETLASLPIRIQADLVSRMPARDRLQVLLHAPRPMRVTRALPDADLYLTIRDVGPLDGTPLLKLASWSQIQHLIDLESWRGDRFDPGRAGGWVALLLEAEEETLGRFLGNADDELLALMFHTWIRVGQFEYEDGADVHGHGVSEAGTEQGFATPDGYHYFSPLVPQHAPAIRRILQIFYQTMPDRYQQALWSSQYELPSELEEGALRWRQSRLEEHGFPPPDEALAVYAAPCGSALPSDSAPAPKDADGLGASRVPLALGEFSPRLPRAIETLDDPTRDRVLFETLSLAQHLLVADAHDPGDPEAHRAALEKGAGYVGIALQTRRADTPQEAGRVLADTPVVELFREGYALAIRLQERAHRWATDYPGALDLLDPPVGERIRGLFLARPLYLETSESSQTAALRDFRSAHEVEETRVALEMAEVVSAVLITGLGLDVERVVETSKTTLHPPRFASLWLTLLAWHASRKELSGAPLPESVVADFLRTVASRRTAAPEAPLRATVRLVQALQERFELPARDRAVLESFGRFCLERLADECGMLEPGTPIDPRYVSCLLLSDPSE